MKLTQKHIKQLTKLGFKVDGDTANKHEWRVRKGYNHDTWYVENSYFYEKNDWVTKHISKNYKFDKVDDMVKALSEEIDIESFRYVPERDPHPYRN